jgi:hypothetical protein
MITKLVNIYAPIAIRVVKPPVSGKVDNVTMSLGDIKKCLYARATVHEVLADGTTVKLTLKNYRDDHSHLIKPVAPDTTEDDVVVNNEVDSGEIVDDNIDAKMNAEIDVEPESDIIDEDANNTTEDGIIESDASENVPNALVEPTELDVQDVPKKNTSTNKKKKNTNNNR